METVLKFWLMHGMPPPWISDVVKFLDTLDRRSATVFLRGSPWVVHFGCHVAARLRWRRTVWIPLKRRAHDKSVDILTILQTQQLEFNIMMRASFSEVVDGSSQKQQTNGAHS